MTTLPPLLAVLLVLATLYGVAQVGVRVGQQTCPGTQTEGDTR